MATNRLTVSQLIEELKKFPSDCNVVIARPQGYEMQSKVEFDGIEHIQLIDMAESWDVYIKGEPGDEKALLLSSVPIDNDLWE